MENITRIIRAQKAFFQSHKTKDLIYRKTQLRLLYQVIKSNEKEIFAALFKDFAKSEFESYTSETGLVMNEISSQLKNLDKWAAPRNVGGAFIDFPSIGKIYPEPYGQVLIISPWNYPFQLALSPLAGAIAAGNTAIIKPSELSPSVSAVIAKLISETFPEELIACVEGGIDVSRFLLYQKNDYIFFTGSTKIGKIVMKAAAENLTPVTLELGGKNPCIVDATAPVKLTAKRIAWGKFLNAGQTCVAPDYVLVHRKISDELKEQLKNAIISFYGNYPCKSPDFARIINSNHFNRIASLIDPSKVFYGGEINSDILYISPTILHKVSPDEEIMKDEIFGPVLPVLEYDTIDEAIKIVLERPNPLSFYLFTKERKIAERIIREIPAGNGNINDTVMQFINNNLPFGGFGSSGVGSYHGKSSFECFSHMKSLNSKSLIIDFPIRYPPYNSFKLNLLRKIYR